MKYVQMFFGWVWARKAFFATAFASALLFFVWLFPFSDLSDAVTSAIARGSNNQLYVQFKSLDINLLPMVAASAEGVAADIGNLPTLEVEYLKVRPSWLYLVLSPVKLVKAIRGDMEAQMYTALLALSHVRADGMLGGDFSMDLAPDKVENGVVTTRTSVDVENLDLNKLQSWAELPVKMKGKMDAEMQMKVNAAMQEQPEGEFLVKVAKFALPSSTVPTPMGPINLPTLSLENVLLRGRLVGGKLIVEEGTFGQPKDPIHGRLKGQIAVRFLPGQGPQMGAYDFTVDLNSSAAIEKELGIAFILFQNAKTPTASGARYLFRAMGQGVGVEYPMPSITRANSF